MKQQLLIILFALTSTIGWAQLQPLPTLFNVEKGDSNITIKDTFNRVFQLNQPFANSENVVQDSIAAWGDSMTEGIAGATAPVKAYPARLSIMSGVGVFNGGVGGQTSTQIRARFTADTTRWSYPTIFWVGANNVSDTTAIIADLDFMTSRMRNKYVILTVCTSSAGGIGTTNYSLVTKLDSLLIARYGSKVIDIRKYLVNSYDKNISQDVIDFANDRIPARFYSDGTHFVDFSYNLVAKKVYEEFGKLYNSDKLGVATNFNLHKSFLAPAQIGLEAPNLARFTKIGLGVNHTITGNNYIDLDAGTGLSKYQLQAHSTAVEQRMYAYNGTNYNPFYMRLKGNSAGSLFFGFGAATNIGSESIIDYFSFSNTGRFSTSSIVSNNTTNAVGGDANTFINSNGLTLGLYRNVDVATVPNVGNNLNFGFYSGTTPLITSAIGNFGVSATNGRMKFLTLSAGTLAQRGEFDENGNFGIGVASGTSTAKLHVVGTARITGLTSGASTDSIVTVDASGNLRDRTAKDVVSGYVKSGTGTLTNGTVTIATTAITANSRIIVSYKTASGATGILTAPSANRTVGTSFVVNSVTAGLTTVLTTDNSTFDWVIID